MNRACRRLVHGSKQFRGNATCYGHVVPAERLYCDHLLEAGFVRAEARAIRKRNSKKELVEFHVIAARRGEGLETGPTEVVTQAR